MGNTYLSNCRQMNVEPEGTAVAGRILGMISAILLILGFAIGGLIMCGGILATGT